MKILIGDKWGVDFDAPIKMSSEQKDKFIGFLKTLFSVVEEEYTGELRVDRIGDKLFMKEWTPAELALLLEVETKDTDMVAEELGRSWMSVDIKRGEFIPKYLAWVRERGIDLLSANTKELIKEFMKEKQDLIISRRRKRTELRKLREAYNLTRRERAPGQIFFPGSEKVQSVLKPLGLEGVDDEGERKLLKRIKILEKELEE